MKSRSLCSLPATGGVEEVSPYFQGIVLQGVTVHAKSAYAYACFACAMYACFVGACAHFACAYAEKAHPTKIGCAFFTYVFCTAPQLVNTHTHHTTRNTHIHTNIIQYIHNNNILTSTLISTQHTEGIHTQGQEKGQDTCASCSFRSCATTLPCPWSPNREATN